MLADCAVFDKALLEHVLSKKWKALSRDEEAKEDEWDPVQVREDLMGLQERLARQLEQSPPKLFERSCRLLVRCRKRRSAGFVTTKAVGHLLPAELVDLFRYAFYSADNIKALLVERD